jgi:hypothetical protein
MNVSFNALDWHVRYGCGGQAALIYDSAVTGTTRMLSCSELLDEVARFIGVLRGLGVDRGDRVVTYLPMIPEAVATTLVCARIGTVHSVVLDGFAAHELALRIDDAAPKVIVSASRGTEVTRVLEYKPMLDRVIEQSAYASGVVISGTAEVGDDVTIYQGVTLGGMSLDRVKRHPTVGNRVACAAGVKVLGSITIGDDSRIGANAVVVKSVPPNSVVIGVPGQVIARSRPHLVADRADLESALMPDLLGSGVQSLLLRVDELETVVESHANHHDVRPSEAGGWRREDFSI